MKRILLYGQIEWKMSKYFIVGIVNATMGTVIFVIDKKDEVNNVLKWMFNNPGETNKMNAVNLSEIKGARISGRAVVNYEEEERTFEGVISSGEKGIFIVLKKDSKIECVLNNPGATEKILVLIPDTKPYIIP